MEKEQQKPITQAELNAILASDYPADFSNRLLVGVTLSNSDLEGTDFRGAVLRGCTISHCKLDNSNFSGADLGDTAFVRCKMEYCHFDSTEMNNATFDRCALMGSTGINGDTRTQSEVIFDENMDFVRGVNVDLLPKWRQFVWEMCGPDQDNYEIMLDLLSENFYQIDEAYPGMGAEIFNSGLLFLPQELSGAANYIAQGNTVKAAYQWVVGSDLDNKPLPDHEVFVLPHSDVQKNLLAERAFAARMQRIEGLNFFFSKAWFDLARDLSEADDGVYDHEDYRQLLRQYGDAFEQIEQSYPGVAAAMFNCGVGYLPSEMLAAADWISNGASPEEVLEACIAQHELSGIHHRHELWHEGHPDGARADFTGRTLKNLDFTGMDFYDANFSDVRLENCWMNGVDFSLSDFTGAAFLDVSAIDADFGSADFDGSSLVRSDFRDAYLGEASFIGAALDACDFSGADMETADFSRAEIQNCRGLEGQSAGPAMKMQ